MIRLLILRCIPWYIVILLSFNKVCSKILQVPSEYGTNLTCGCNQTNNIQNITWMENDKVFNWKSWHGTYDEVALKSYKNNFTLYVPYPEYLNGLTFKCIITTLDGRKETCMEIKLKTFSCFDQAPDPLIPENHSDVSIGDKVTFKCSHTIPCNSYITYHSISWFAKGSRGENWDRTENETRLTTSKGGTFVDSTFVISKVKNEDFHVIFYCKISYGKNKILYPAVIRRKGERLSSVLPPIICISSVVSLLMLLIIAVACYVLLNKKSFFKYKTKYSFLTLTSEKRDTKYDVLVYIHGTEDCSHYNLMIDDFIKNKYKVVSHRDVKFGESLLEGISKLASESEGIILCCDITLLNNNCIYNSGYRNSFINVLDAVKSNWTKFASRPNYITVVYHKHIHSNKDSFTYESTKTEKLFTSILWDSSQESEDMAPLLKNKLFKRMPCNITYGRSVSNSSQTGLLV